jgi:hypothetical protein
LTFGLEWSNNTDIESFNGWVQSAFPIGIPGRDGLRRWNMTRNTIDTDMQGLTTEAAV